MEVWEKRKIFPVPLSSSGLAVWFLGFVLALGLRFQAGSQRAAFNGAKRNTLFVIMLKTTIERICASCWKCVRVHKSRKVEDSVSRKSVLSQQSWAANAMGFSPSMDLVSLFCFFSAGVKFRVLEQRDGKPLRLLMQVSHLCTPWDFLLQALPQTDPKVLLSSVPVLKLVPLKGPT